MHGGGWSWKSLILGWKETEIERNIVVLISSLKCSVICVIKHSDCGPYKPYHAHQNSDVTGVRHQLYPGCWNRLIRLKKECILPVKEYNIDLRSSEILRGVDSQSLLTDVSTACGSHLPGSDIFWTA